MKELILLLDTNSKKHLYEQIYEFIRKEIREGKLRHGERLPSTRLLASQLQIARTTVDQAYEQLAAEGYIEARPYRGFFVSDIKQIAWTQQEETVETTDVLWGENVLGENEKQTEETPFAFDFSPNGMDMGEFPFDTWKRIHKQVLLDRQESVLFMGDSRGDRVLRETICRYLHAFRGVNCHPDQIVIGAGNDYLMLLLQKLLGGEKRIAMENATYPRAYHIFQHGGYEVCISQSDENGIMPQQLEENGVQLVYTMPAHQFPLGTTMPLTRRLELLDWAAGSKERYLIEDDYDSEFRYRGKPIPALQSYDTQGKVIYIGTFSKSIAPAIRISYMVLPILLAKEFMTNLSFLSSTVSRIDQAVLNEFIAKGHFERYLNKMRKHYHAKRDRMVELLAPFGERFEITGSDAGLHMILRSKETCDGMQGRLIQLAQQQGCKVYGLSEYEIQPSDEGTVLLGYGGMSEQEMEQGIERLRKAWL